MTNSPTKPAKSASAAIKPYYLFFAILTLIALAAIASNIVLRRGPVHDATVVQDIQVLQANIESYYLKQGQLPTSLGQLSLPGQTLADRLSNYDYQPTAAATYQLCATFQSDQTSAGNTYRTYPGTTTPDPNTHAKGRQCFTYSTPPSSGGPYPLKD